MLSSTPGITSVTPPTSAAPSVTSLCSSGCPSTSLFIPTSCIGVSTPMSLPVSPIVSSATSITASMMQQAYESPDSVAILPRPFLPVTSLEPSPGCVQVAPTTASVLSDVHPTTTTTTAAAAAAAAVAEVAAVGATYSLEEAVVTTAPISSLGYSFPISQASEDSEPLPITPVPVVSAPENLTLPLLPPTSSDSIVTTCAPLTMPFQSLCSVLCPAVASVTSEFTTISSVMPMSNVSVLSSHNRGQGGAASVSDSSAGVSTSKLSAVSASELSAVIGVDVDVTDPMGLANTLREKVLQLSRQEEAGKVDLQHDINAAAAAAAAASVSVQGVSGVMGAVLPSSASLPPPSSPPPPPPQSSGTATSSATAVSPLSPLFHHHDIPVAHPLTPLKRGYDHTVDDEPQRIPNVVSVEFIQNRRPFRCTHAGCDKTFKNQQTLMMHHKTHFVEDGSLKLDMEGIPTGVRAGRNKKIPSCCPECGRTFVGLYELRRHYGRKHSLGEKMFSCRKCGKKFFIDVDLRDHEKFCGEAIRCRCGQTFAYKCNLVAHKKANPACQGGGGPGQVQQQVAGLGTRQQRQQAMTAIAAAAAAAEGQRYKKMSSSSPSSMTISSTSPFVGALPRATTVTTTTALNPALFVHLPQQRQQQEHLQHHPHPHHHQAQMGTVTAVTQGLPIPISLPYVLAMQLPATTGMSSHFARGDGGHLASLPLQAAPQVLSFFDGSRGSAHVQSTAAAMAAVRGS